MNKYLRFFKIGFQVAFTYRANIIFRVFRHALIVILFFLLWGALLKPEDSFNGFNLKTLITYYILVEIVDVIYTQMPARRFNNDIKNGDLNNYLIKPLNYWKYLLFYTFGHQIAAGSFSILVVIGAFIFLPQYLTLPLNLLNFLAFIISCLLGFLISHQILFTVGLLGFWVSEVSHIRQGTNQLMGLLGGHWIPLALFPAFFLGPLNYLPFKYLYNFPVKIFTNQVALPQLLLSFLIEIIWLITFLALGRFVWQQGVKKYEAYGQ